MSEWAKRSIENVCLKVSSGGTPSRKRPDYYEDGTHYWVKSKELADGPIYETEELITDEALANSSAKLYPPNTLLIAMYGGSPTAGMMGYLKTEAAVNQAICAMITDEEVAHYKYLLYALVHYREGLTMQAHGAAQQNLNQGMVRRYEIPFPPVETQRRIAGILSAYDDLIETNTRRIRVLEEMARALYREWFVHYRFPGHEDVAMVEHADLGEVPEGWEVRTLDEVLGYNIGGGWGKEEPEGQFTERVTVVRGTDMPSARHNDFEGCPIRYIKPSQLKSRRLEEGDILMEVSGGSKDQPVGRTLYVSDTLLRSVSEEPICASFCKLLRADRAVLHPRLLSAHFEEMYNDRRIEQYQVQSTGLKNLKFAHLLEHEVVVPPSKLQRRYVELTRPSLDLAQLLGVKNRNLRQTRDLLLPRLVSGTLPVEAAEAELAEVA